MHNASGKINMQERVNAHAKLREVIQDGQHPIEEIYQCAKKFVQAFEAAGIVSDKAEQGRTELWEALAQRFNEILKAYGVLFSDETMRSRLIIDLMSEVTGGTLTVTE